MKLKFIAIVSLLVVSSAIAVLLGWGNNKKSQTALAQTYNIRQEHPRLILTPEKMQQVMAKVQTNDPDWQTMYNTRYDYVSGNLPYGVGGFLLKWELLYKITGEKIFLDRIREALWTESVLDNFDYKDRNSFRGAGLTFLEIYDWLYYDWTATEREDFKQHIITWFGYWRSYVNYDNNFAGYRWSDSDETKSLALNFLAIGAALYGDYAEANISLDVADKMWKKIEEIFWTKMGGIPTEGSYYGDETREYTLDYLLLLKSSQGRGMPDYSAETLNMLKEYAYYLLYSSSPDLKWAYPFGDIQEPAKYGSVNNGRGRSYSTLKLMELLDGTQEAGYLRGWIDKTSVLPIKSDSTDTTVNEMLFNNRLAPKLSYDALSVDKLFEEGRMIFSESSWNFSQDTVWWGFQYHRGFVDHMHSDMLSYQIMRGDDFVTKEVSGYEGASELGRAHNTILVKNEEDNYSGGGYGYTDGLCILKSYVSDTDFTYINVDASLAYSSFINPYWDSAAEKVMRKFLYIKPNLFVVFDIVKTTEVSGNAAKAISNHFMHEPVINGNIISSYEGDSRIFVKYLSPALIDLKITKFDETIVYPGPGDYMVPQAQKKWQTLTESQSNPPLVNFMHVIEVGDAGPTEMVPSTLIQSQTGNMTGAQIQNQIVLFSNDIAKNGLNENIIYNVSGTGSSKHFITDLKPNTQFTITNTNLDTGQVVQTQTLNSSAKGTLYFTTQLGSNHQITIQPQGAAPIPACLVAGGTCQANACNTYGSCASLIGICSSGNCCSGACTVVIPAITPNITLTKTADKTEASQGEEIIYTITYANTGTGGATDVVITDVIPQGATYVADSASNGGALSTSSGQATLTWTIASVASGGSGMVSFRVMVD